MHPRIRVDALDATSVLAYLGAVPQMDGAPVRVLNARQDATVRGQAVWRGAARLARSLDHNASFVGNRELFSLPDELISKVRMDALELNIASRS